MVSTAAAERFFSRQQERAPDTKNAPPRSGNVYSMLNTEGPHMSTNPFASVTIETVSVADQVYEAVKGAIINSHPCQGHRITWPRSP